VQAEDEFHDFVVGRSRAMLAFAWMLTYDEGRAEDLLQTSLAKTWLHWGRLRHDGDPVAYVRRVMVNTATAWWRRRWRAEVPTEVVPELPGRDEYATSDHRDALMRALASLPRRQRAVVVLRYYEGLSEVETAEALGCSVGTVKSQAARGLARLRELNPVAEPAEESR
jgi:RNA polymerase sigma-70 factor (sigma-E family)